MVKRTKQVASVDSNPPVLSADLIAGASNTKITPVGATSEFAEFNGVFIDRTISVRMRYAAVPELRAALAVGQGEVIGLLLGSRSSQTLYIESYEPILPAGENPEVAWLRTAVGRFTGGKPEPVGFFRTQLAGEPKITQFDCDIVRGHLPNVSENGGVFAVIGTSRSRPWSATLFAIDSEGNLCPGRPLLQFPFNANLLRKTFSSDFVPEFESPQLQQIPPPSRPKPIASMRFNGTQLAKRDLGLRIVGGLCIGGLLGAGIIYTRQLHAFSRNDAPNVGVATYQPLGLRVIRSGSDFEVSWDRSSNLVRSASAGTLTIRDGELTQVLNLDPIQLREGRILYSSLFRELIVKLEISQNQRHSAGESVHFLGWDTNPSASFASANLPDLPASASQTLVQPSPLPRVASSAATPAERSTNPAERRIIQAPLVLRKESESPQSLPVAKAAPASEIRPEIPRTAPLTDEVEPSSTTAALVQTPTRDAEPLVAHLEPTATLGPLVVTPPPLTANVVPPPGPTIQQAKSQPIMVSSALQAAKAIKLVPPSYPPIAKSLHLQGTVRFNALVGGDGRIRNLQYVSGPSIMVPAASDAVKQWIYQPTLLNGQPIEVQTTINVNFKLNP
jgi:outer membrane biosynthesis protein TonB